MAAEVLARSHRYGLANALYRRVLALDPHSAHAWNNLGHALHTAYRVSEATQHFIKALNCGGEGFDAINNLMLMAVVRGDHRQAIRLLPYALFHATDELDRRTAYSSASLAYLAMRDWEHGWPAFECMLGDVKARKRREFNDAPDWEGQPVPGHIVVYGEQGIGDEIMFASMIPDMIKAGHRPIIECDHRLRGLFQRSFDCPVFGTRHVKSEERKWLNGLDVSAKCAGGSLAQFFLRSDQAFPRTPYLTPCPTRSRAIRSSMASIQGLKVGLAWTGGLPSTRTRDRSLTLALLRPLLAIPGISWFSLEYKGPTAPDPIIDWHEFTRSPDYDDTAALISELDLVVSVTTATALTCGAIGKECLVLVPEHPTWHWAEDGGMPWFDSLKLFRRKGEEWKSSMDEMRAELLRRIQRA